MIAVGYQETQFITSSLIKDKILNLISLNSDFTLITILDEGISPSNGLIAFSKSSISEE